MRKGLWPFGIVVDKILSLEVVVSLGMMVRSRQLVSVDLDAGVFIEWCGG